MNWEMWRPYYIEVVELLGINSKADLNAANKYLDLTRQYRSTGYEIYLKGIFQQKENIKRVWVFGAGPSLIEDFQVFVKHFNPLTDFVMAADGATVFLLQNEVLPDVIVSDYDGDLNALHFCCQQGSLLQLHAHGDNYSIVQEEFPIFVQEGLVLPTVQTEPKPPFLFNYGGFTDGD
ncbi:MAG: 6-hydroxymethylpterin diphosphokinase MptE-like protein, partial [Candidatus Hodarchaeales archaeon]